MTNDLAIRILSGDILGTTEQTHEAVAMAVKALSALPSAQPIVRCKDCKHSYVFEPWEGINAVRYCKIFKNHYGDSDFCVNDDDFCSCGEKKDE